jgi:predicted transcriptional regulator
MNFNRTGSDVNSKSNVSSLGQTLLQLIYRYPGVRYRELLRMTHSSNGVLSYRLTQLERSQDINVNRNQRVTRYYLPDISIEVSKIIGHTKNPISRSILLLLVEKGPSLASEISSVTKRAPSTISWYLHRLVDAGIIRKGTFPSRTNHRYYDVVDKTLVQEVLSRYAERPVDKVVGNYLEIMDEL